MSRRGGRGGGAGGKYDCEEGLHARISGRRAFFFLRATFIMHGRGSLWGTRGGGGVRTMCVECIHVMCCCYVLFFVLLANWEEDRRWLAMTVVGDDHGDFHGWV